MNEEDKCKYCHNPLAFKEGDDPNDPEVIANANRVTCLRCADDISPEDYEWLAKYLKRTGIFRMYVLLRPPIARTQLVLEFVIRGKVLFSVKLWKRKHSIFRDEY